MSVVVSIAREEPLCVKATADAAAAWGRNDKGYGYWGCGTMEYPDGGRLEVTLNIGVRPHGNFAEFSNFPHDLEISGELTDDSAAVGVYAIRHGNVTVAIMMPALQDELETNLDQAIELDRVVIATGAATHVRMSVTLKLRSGAQAAEGEVADEETRLRQVEIGVSVQGSSRAAAGSAPATHGFLEQTSTAIVFAQGGVVRLSEIVTAGQILLLRHLGSNQEAACRVVSVRKNAEAKSYVDLEFLQAAPGFWGTDFAAAEVKPGAAGARAKESATSKLKGPVAPKLKSSVPAAGAGISPAGNPKSAPSTSARNPFSKWRDAPILAEVAVPMEQPASEVQAARAAPAEAVVAEAESETTGVEVHSAVNAAEIAVADVEPAPGVVPAPVAVEAAPIATEPADAAPALDVVAPSVAAEAVTVATEPAPVAPPSAEAEIAPALAGSAALPSAKILSGAQSLPGGPLSGGEADHGWNRESRSKPLRIVLAVVAAAALAVAVAGGFYRWHLRNAGYPPAYIQAVSTDANPAAGPAPDSTVGPAPVPVTQAAPSAGSPAASSTVTAAAATNSRVAVPPSVAAQPSATAQAVARKATARTIGPAPSAPVAARGPSVAATQMSAPTAAAARTAEQATPAVASDMPSAMQNASTAGILPDAAQSAGPAAPPLARTSSGVQQPRLLSAPAPVYPYAAQAEHIEGDVAVDVMIDENGKVTGMTVLSGPHVLREAALDALRQRKYAPGTLDGKPTAAHVVVTIHFQL